MTFDTPEPISATIAVVLGDVRISASDRGTTVVEVQPSDASNGEDRKAAQQTVVECADGQLLVKAPKSLRSWRPGSTGGSVDVTVELPEGSRLHGSGQLADFHCDGRLGECRITTGVGRIRVDEAAKLSLKSGTGDISVNRVTGEADVTAGSGEVRLRELDAAAVIKNSNGDTWVGEVRGHARFKAANGSIAVDRANASVVAKTANGDVRLGEVARGSVVLETSAGDLEVGIGEGTAAWLDVSSRLGRIHNALESAPAPGSSAETVEVRARTSLGDIVVRRPVVIP
jgi:putative adhesin